MSQEKMIAGAGGGGGGGSGRAAVEDADSLRSRAMVSILDLLGEGEIGGLVNGAKTIYFDETVLQNNDGTYNFPGVAWEERTGTQDQTSIPNFSTVESPSVVNVRAKQSSPVTFAVTNSEADYVRVIMSLPSLMWQDNNTGDLKGTSVSYKMSISTDGGPFKDVEVSKVWATSGTWDVDAGVNRYQANRASGSYGLRASIQLVPGVATNGHIIVQPEYTNHADGAPENWQPLGKSVKMTCEAFAESLNDDGYTHTWGHRLTPPITVESSAAKSIRFRVVEKYIKPFIPTSIYNFGWASQQSLNLGINGSVQSYIPSYSVVVSGKSRSKYQRAHMLKLPKPGTSWNVRVTRLTADSEAIALSNETWVDSFVEIVDQKFNYPNSALVGLTIDSAQFNKIPARAYLVDGMYIKVPTNYNPDTREYTGVWNGLFKLAISNNPAWVMYDLILSKRYGLGEYVSASQIDVGKLYQIGRYCDELVPDGTGNQEPRFTLNAIINEPVEAYQLLADLTAVFRGMPFWAGGLVQFTQDAPGDAGMVFSQANVVDGMFSYAGASLKDKHSVVLVRWNDPKENYRQVIEYIEDRELVEKYGIRKLELSSFGCTSRGQAARLGRWVLYTEKFESNFITFKVGLDAATVLPGEIVKISDRFRAGKKMAGRIAAVTPTSVTLDAPVTLDAAGAFVSLRLPDGSFVDRAVAQGAGTFSTLTWGTALAELPVANAMFLVTEPDLQPVLARVVGISEVAGRADQFEIIALEHNPSKYGVIEEGLVLESIPTVDILAESLTPPESIELVESQYLVSSNALGNRLGISWVGKASYYELRWRCVDPLNMTNWESITTSNMSVDITGVSLGAHEFTITSISSFGRRSTATIVNYMVLGNIAPPSGVENFSAEKRTTDILLSWSAVPDVDLKGYEIRVGNSWESAELLISNFQGTSFIDDRERGGTYRYMIRAIDFDNQYSETPSIFELVLNTPVSVDGFDAIQNGTRIDFKWYANPEPDIVYYEIREGETWASSSLVTQTQTTTYSTSASFIAGDKTFWIKAVSAPGIYSDAPVFARAVVAASNDRNLIFSQDEYLTWTGTWVNLTLVSTFLEVTAGKSIGEYNYEIALPSSYRARNIVETEFDAVMSDSTTWADATFTWASPSAGRSWTIRGDSAAISTEVFISRELPTLPTELVEGFSFKNSLVGARGAALIEFYSPTYAAGRHHDGLSVSNTRLTWPVNVSDNWSMSFWFKAGADPSSSFVEFASMLKIAGTPYVISLAISDQGIICSDYPSEIAEVSISSGDHVFVMMSQTSAGRRMYVKKLEGEEAFVEFTTTHATAMERMILGEPNASTSTTFFPFVVSDVHVTSIPVMSSLVQEQIAARYQSAPSHENFHPFISGDHEYQNAIFKVAMIASGDAAPRLKAITTQVDVPDVLDGGVVTTSSSATVRVDFSRVFYTPPEVTTALKGGSVVSSPRVVSVDTTGFDIEALNASSTRVVATVSWSAKGY
jgi:predicted phage tail protein